MYTLCWNCRGLGDPSTVRELSDLTRECAPTILCVVERQIAKYRVEGLASTLGFDSAYGVGSSGRSEGLCIFWKNSVDLMLRNFSKYHIDMVVTETGKDPWRLTCWYGEADRSLRYRTWDMMRFLRADERELLWMCIGDFNEVLRREEHMGQNDRAWSQIQQFREVVDACALADIGYVGMDWTFAKKVAWGQYCRVRLDHVLASNEWCSMFPFVTLRHLTTVKSDHSPILLMNELEANNRRIAIDRPFRYEVMWERHEEFNRVFQQAWTSRPKSATAAELREKLHTIAAALSSWSSQSFGSVRKELRELKGRSIT